MDLTATAENMPAAIGGGGEETLFTPAAEETTPLQTEPPPTDYPTNQPDRPTQFPTATFTPSATFTPTPSPTVPGTPLPPILYNALAGDTLPAVSIRFGVSPEEIKELSPSILPDRSLIQPGTLLLVPNRLGEAGPSDLAIPDSEIVYSPSALDFDIEAFVNEAGGYLSTYREYMPAGWRSGAQVVERVAIENSINPRLLLALLEYQSHWVYGQPTNLAEKEYPLGWIHLDRRGLYKQLTWAMQRISLGYYSWRDGSITSVTFLDGSSLRMAPNLNAGTAAIQYYFALLNEPVIWVGILGGTESFPVLYERMFGNPWLRAQTVEPLLPLNLTQPVLEFPFLPGRVWAFTGGPHAAWAKDGARAALDFAPSASESGCKSSTEWIAASAPGLVVRTGDGVVVVDLDGDGYEQTGWVLLYLHVASSDKVSVGTILEQDGRIGHPSCEGGSSTGTHVHIARKYNGEWVLADGPLPFTLSGWQAVAGPNPYEGILVRGDDVVNARTYGSYDTLISRPIQ